MLTAWPGAADCPSFQKLAPLRESIRRDVPGMAEMEPVEIGYSQGSLCVEVRRKAVVVPDVCRSLWCGPSRRRREPGEKLTYTTRRGARWDVSLGFC